MSNLKLGPSLHGCTKVAGRQTNRGHLCRLTRPQTLPIATNALQTISLPIAPTRQELLERVLESIPVPANTTATTAEWKSIVNWVENGGGYIDPRLSLVDDAPCGCRGVVATTSVASSDLQEAPLIVVPESLYLTTEDADALLQKSLKQRPSSPAAQSLLPKLPAATRLALLLAHEAAVNGDQSRWWPYISALPKTPPCAWLMTPAELAAALSDLGPVAHGWQAQVQQARRAMEAQAEACHRAFGGSLGVQQEQILWSMAQV